MIRNRTTANTPPTSIPIPDTEFVDRETAAKILGIKSQTLAVWASAKRNALPYYKVGHKSVRYKVSDLLSFIENGRVE
jgi:Helix-turn-helix domain